MAWTAASTAARPLSMRCFLPRNYIDEKVKHIAFRKSRSNIGSLQSSAFILLGVYPSAHCKLCDEDVATLCK